MATDAADPPEQGTDAGTATLERKRPHDIISHDEASNTGSAHSTPRKRAKKAGKLGHQDVRDFVPVGASFSTSVVPVDVAQDGDDDGSEMEMKPKAEALSEDEISEVSESEGAEQQKALVEGRRLLVKDLPPDTTEEDLNQFFKGYPIQKIWLPDRMADNSPVVSTAPKEDSSVNGDSSITSPVQGVANDRLRLENVTIRVNPRTQRPLGNAFVTVSTSDDADRAIAQLSGREIFERQVTIQRARAHEMISSDSGTVVVQEGAFGPRTRNSEGSHGNGSVEAEDNIQESCILDEVSESTSPKDVQAGPPVNWNSVNTTKIRTSLGGSVGKAMESDNSGLTNGGRLGNEHSSRDLATKVALERVEGLRLRLSSMNPHDGPVSAYGSTQQELHDAEVDYNYCLYFPRDEEFRLPPTSPAHKFKPMGRGSREYRLRLWSIVEQCMKDRTLQDLKEGKIRVANAEHLDQTSPAQTEQVDGHRDLEISTATDPKHVQNLDTQETIRKQSGYLKAFPHMKPGSHNYERMKKRIHETEVHLNYCKYFPVNEGYLPLALAKKGVNEHKSPRLDATERRAAQIWKFVEQCAQDGVLQDLKDGRLAAWVKDVPPPNQSFFASAPQAEQDSTGLTGHSLELSNAGRVKEAIYGDASGSSADVKPAQTAEGKPNERQRTSESDRGVMLNLDYGNQELPSEVGNVDVRHVTESRNKDVGAPLDVDDQDMKQEVSAINQVDDDLYASDSGTASNSDTESNGSSMDSEGQSEDGDAMMQHPNSVQILADEAEQNQRKVGVPPSHTARVLADLSPYDLNAQLRYFHPTKVGEEVDGNTPVRCLVCAKDGHMAGMCEFLTCSNCGAFSRHSTQACPDSRKCGKCREQGHDEGRCPHKLKRMPRHEIVCDLCQRNGHIEEDCELVWRTSGRPWDSDLAHSSVRLSCYECGHSGHLGNDCPSRKPHKPMGTSTWDGNKGPVSIKSARDIKIKGKATRQDPINLDDSDDERRNFYRPKISLPEPVRRGQIRIITGRRESTEYEPSRNDGPAYADHGYSSFTPVNEPYRNDEARQPYQEYRDGGRSNWRAVDGPDNATGHNDLRYDNYRPSERRSRSPPCRDHNGYAGGRSRLPPRPAPRDEHQDRRPRADTNVYRPMPSAAQNAWIRRRV